MDRAASTRARPATFTGIGAQKTASTWLHGVLAQLPGVSTSDPKELDFFSSTFDRGYEWYERHFDPDAAHRGEVSPSYFIDADAPERARRYNPDMRILVTLRDPVARAYSNHMHEVRAGHVSGANLCFESALENNPLYIEQGRYPLHLRRWTDAFGADNVLVLFQEDIRADADMQTRRVADFLGIDGSATVVQRKANESAEYRNRTVGMTLWRAGRLARRAGLGGAVEGIKQLPGIRQFRAANRREIRDTVEPMTPETERRLTDLYRAEVAELADLVGRMPPWPRFRESRERDR